LTGVWASSAGAVESASVAAKSNRYMSFIDVRVYHICGTGATDRSGLD
jgi:hypothetical protein